MRATSKIVKKYGYKCHGGPYSGKELKLTTPSTLPFSCNGKKGRYRPAHIKSTAVLACSLAIATDLLWEEIK